jgi:hypothetical protein
MNNEGVHRRLESYNFLSEVILFNIFSQDSLENLRIVLEEFLIKEAEKTDTLNG